MSKAMTATQQLTVFKNAGLKVSEHAGWKTHKRPGDYGDMHGLVIHHTAGTSDAADERVLYNGRDDLPGPLSQWGMRDDGTVVMIGNGRCNHAGVGSQSTYDKVLSENYTGDIKPGPDNFTAGNAHYYGLEVMYSGTVPPTKAQYAAMVKLAAAVCKFHGWSAKSVIGHKEHTRRKVDPYGVDMSDFRAAVQKVIDGPPPSTKVYYTIKAGDSLYYIAGKFKTTVAAIAKLNPEITNVNKIPAGLKIRVK